MTVHSIVAEIGINHNGDLNTAKQLIKLAADKGCHAVKFQKRTIDLVYTEEELAKPRESVFGDTNGDLKRGLEFGYDEYEEIDKYCRELGIIWFASPWDVESIKFLQEFNQQYLKIPSALATDRTFLQACKDANMSLILSTGMMDLPMIQKAVDILKPNISYLLHCTSTYPSKVEELNLSAIKTLKTEFPNLKIGYSGHEPGVYTTVMAAVLGAEMIERHITLSRSMWGSDQAASLEPPGLELLVREINAWEKAEGTGIIEIYESELPIIEKLRKVDDL